MEGNYFFFFLLKTITSHLFIKDTKFSLGELDTVLMLSVCCPRSALHSSPTCSVLCGLQWADPGFLASGWSRWSEGWRSQWLACLFSLLAFREDAALSGGHSSQVPAPLQQLPLPCCPASPRAGDSSAVASHRVLHHACWFLWILPTPTNKLFFKSLPSL